MPYVAEYMEDKNASFAIQLILCFLQNAALALFEPACFSIFGMLGGNGQYINGFMSGMSFGGVLISLLQFFCIGVFDSDASIFNISL